MTKMTYLKAVQTGTHLASNGWTLDEVKKVSFAQYNFNNFVVKHVLDSYSKQLTR
jgi:hypothetical protein